jgi:suppressor of ftsI
VPLATDQGPRRMQAIVAFTNPVIRGSLGNHPLAADHEPKGMMGIVEVTA